MTEYRAKPGNLCMAEAVPFGQRYNYHGDIPVKDMLHKQFFMPVRNHFRPGDTVRLVRVEGDRVVEFGDAIVVQVTRESVDVCADGPVHKIPATVAEEAPLPETSRAAPDLFWKKGFGCFQVLDAKGTVIAEMPTRADVVAMIEEKTGKPAVKWEDEAA